MNRSHCLGHQHQPQPQHQPQRRRQTTIAVALLLGLLPPALAAAQSNDRTPVLIDTDIGADINDTFALGLAFGSEELQVLGVTTVGDDTHKKAMMMCRLLTMTGRRHTRVAAGAKPQSSRPITNLRPYYYHPDALFDRTTKPEKQSAVDFLHRRARQHPRGVTVLALGPLTNLARLLAAHTDAAEFISRIVLLESNLARDAAAARQVFAAGIPLVVISADASRRLRLNDAGVKKVFGPGTALTRQVQAMYQMWDRGQPPLDEAFAVALCFDERFAKFQKRPLAVDEQGRLVASQGQPQARLAASVKSHAFVQWYASRMASLVSPADKPSRLLEDGRMPNRVHVAEDFDSDIERSWWMSGKPETKLLPQGSRRACRGVLTHDFDALLMASRRMYSAVIFNPVPGPPMGKRTRLSFRYWLQGTDRIRVQIYSLTNGYHRHLVVQGLPQQQWRRATVDMTEARRPDGTGGPLSENERIDDIQFYADPDAEIVIDDIVLYDAAAKDETRPFPKRVLFTGTFDTGQQGRHWPGDFEIVDDAGSFWKAARSIPHGQPGPARLRVQLRGQRRLGGQTQLSFRYRLTGGRGGAGGNSLNVRLVNSKSGRGLSTDVKHLKSGQWAPMTVRFDTRELPSINEVHLSPPQDSELLIDDLLLFEPGAE